MSIRFDYHSHSTYSDGAFLHWMLSAAESAGLDGLGVTDHCNVSGRAPMVRRKRTYGFNLDATYERRRAAIRRLRADDEVDIYPFDGVEVDYHPADEDRIADFLDDAGFDYAIGSVHFVENEYVNADELADRPEPERRRVLDRYYDQVVALAEADLFEVAGHVDLPRRDERYRGLSTREDYERVAVALGNSRTVPELNAGRSSEGYFHPAPAFLDALRDHGVDVTVGTDSHGPDELRGNVERLGEHVADLGVDPVEVVTPADV